MPRLSIAPWICQPKRSVANWLRDAFLGFHVLQFLLFLGRYFLSLNVFATRFAAWLVKDDVLAVDDSYRIFNLDCRVRALYSPCTAPVTETTPESFSNTPRSGRYRMRTPQVAWKSSIHG